MDNYRTIKSALISVFSKDGLEELVKILDSKGVKIYSTGGTQKFIENLGISITPVEELTDYPSILGGRVKTLHPKVFGGILNRRTNQEDKLQLIEYKIPEIDLVVVDLYPFEKTVASGSREKEIIEKIDIGGISLIRAAAKNFKDVTVITDKKDYRYLIEELNKNKGSTGIKFREKMSCKAFGLTAYYDSVLSNWFNKKLNILFPEKKTMFGKKISELRYGENPHQKSSIYLNDLSNSEIGLRKIKGKALSYNNYNDIYTGLEILNSFKKKGTVIIKHANPSGVSLNGSPLKTFKDSYLSDPVSAFGGIVACNFKINENIAKEMSKIFFEVGIGQAKHAKEILFNLGYSDLVTYNDLNNIERIVAGKWKN